MSNTNKDKTSTNTNKEDFYKRLKTELDNNSVWPMKYMYKFIVPNESENEAKVLEHFKDKIKVNKNFSRSGKYISISIITNEISSDNIINRYQSMENIEGLIAL
jgi:putative lipoic acid-binding regulatory protein